MKQFEIQCSRCAKRKRVRVDNFALTSRIWKSGGSTLICPECARYCNTITSREQTIENMVRVMFSESECRRRYECERTD